MTRADRRHRAPASYSPNILRYPSQTGQSCQRKLRLRLAKASYRNESNRTTQCMSSVIAWRVRGRRGNIDRAESVGM